MQIDIRGENTEDISEIKFWEEESSVGEVLLRTF